MICRVLPGVGKTECWVQKTSSSFQSAVIISIAVSPRVVSSGRAFEDRVPLRERTRWTMSLSVNFKQLKRWIQHATEGSGVRDSDHSSRGEKKVQSLVISEHSIAGQAGEAAPGQGVENPVQKQTPAEGAARGRYAGWCRGMVTVLVV